MHMAYQSPRTPYSLRHDRLSYPPPPHLESLWVRRCVPLDGGGPGGVLELGTAPLLGRPCHVEVIDGAGGRYMACQIHPHVHDALVGLPEVAALTGLERPDAAPTGFDAVAAWRHDEAVIKWG